MMREIIFRGKRVDSGELVFGDFTHEIEHGDNGMPENYYREIHTLMAYINGVMVIPETVGQFTGLTDKNGVKIFEGDIVFAGYGEYYQGTHEYSTTITVDMSNYDALNALCNANVVEVIGNIHDQKEDVWPS